MKIYVSKNTQKLAFLKKLNQVTPSSYSDKECIDLDERGVVNLIMLFDDMVQDYELDKLLNRKGI